MGTTRITKETLAKLEAPASGQVYLWDDEVTGFGVVLGVSGKRTFVARGRVSGKNERAKVTIGTFGAPGEDGREWTVVLARQKARELLGLMAKGINPNAKGSPTSAATAIGPTLRDGLETHLASMKKKRRAATSLRTFEYEVRKYLADWLDRPMAELTGAVLAELHEQIKRNSRVKANSNPNNEKGAPLANRVVTHVSACFNSLNKKLEGKLGSWNPAKAVDKDILKPKRERLDDLADYAARVATMRNPIQRDGLMFALYTGLRSEDVRTVQWENVDFDEHTLTLVDPKGGEAAAFTIPLSATPMKILRRRQAENATSALFTTAGGDAGYAFPTLHTDRKVGPIGDLRQQVKGEKHTRFPVEDVHTLRRTWESIAHEEGISELDQHVLSNHSFGGHNVNATYISQHIDHLATCAAAIDAGITKRIASKQAPKKRARNPQIRSVA